MKRLITTLLLGAIAVQATSAEAKYARRRYVSQAGAVHRYVTYAPLESAYPYYYNTAQQPPLPFVPYDDSPGSNVLRQTIRAQAEPGLASEIDTSAAQTASGGPVGGIPGRSGGR